MMLEAAPRPPRQSLAEGPSTVFWVAVVACTVLMRPSAIPNLSLMTLASGARQLVVHEALEMMACPAYSPSFTPMTNIGASLDGAEMTTFLAPASRCAWAVSRVVNTPVDSTTKSTSRLPHGMAAGSRSAKHDTTFPSMARWAPSSATSPGYRPCVLSYLNMYAM